MQDHILHFLNSIKITCTYAILLIAEQVVGYPEGAAYYGHLTENAANAQR